MRTLLHTGLLLCVAGTASAQAPAPPKLKFDVVSIKLDRSGEPRGLLQISPDGDRIIVSNAPMFRIVEFAFDFQRNDLIVNTPDWTRTERWDMEAKVAAADIPAFHAMNFVQQKAMLQSALAERCRMQAHVAKKEVPVYALVTAKTGIRMREVKPDEARPIVRDAKGRILSEWDLTVKPGEIHGRAVPMDALMYALSESSLGRQVIDRTQLKGEYNFDLLWTPEENLEASSKAAPSDAGLTEPLRPSIFTAVQEQLGLRLEATKAPVDALFIDHIERPTDD